MVGISLREMRTALLARKSGAREAIRFSREREAYGSQKKLA
jgi:hypothetical protein